MKRSRGVRLVLLGGISTGTFAGCSPGTPLAGPVRISPECVYVNDYFVPGAGYYHAPFHAFFARPYNDYNSNTGQYYSGGEWKAAAFESPINISSPTPDAALLAENTRTDVVRGGFGHSGGYFGGG